MKTIKVILGIITALTIVFFATGLFVKETNYTAEVTGASIVLFQKFVVLDEGE